MFCSEKRWLRKGMIAVCKHLKSCHKEEGEQLFSCCRQDTKGWFETAAKRIQTRSQKKLPAVRAARQWNRLPGEVMDSFLEAFKRRLDEHFKGVV